MSAYNYALLLLIIIHTFARGGSLKVVASGSESIPRSDSLLRGAGSLKIASSLSSFSPNVIGACPRSKVVASLVFRFRCGSLKGDAEPLGAELYKAKIRRELGYLYLTCSNISVPGRSPFSSGPPSIARVLGNATCCLHPFVSGRSRKACADSQMEATTGWFSCFVLDSRAKLWTL